MQKKYVIEKERIMEEQRKELKKSLTKRKKRRYSLEKGGARSNKVGHSLKE